MASSSSSPTPTRWDVFLSFRGIDTRTGFTSHLHSSLCRSGIQTFIDEPELRAGDIISFELLDAIKQSKIYIVVLSKNYASSSWCLNELAEILECRKLMSFSPGNIEQVEGFTKEVADLSGYHLSDQPIKQTELAASSGCELCENRHMRTEADTINDVVERVLLQINPVTLEVARYPVGIDSRVREIESLLRTSSSYHNGVHWIGIYGMGGVGKTTLAKAFYNQMFRSFDGSCFLANIKDVCKVHKGLESLQQQLINEVLKRKDTITISSIDRGISLIRERICSLKVLVVLDDLDHRKQVDYLVGKFLAAGSIIVLTTRNEDLLDKLGVKTKYMVNILDGFESQQLFNQLAFGDTVVSSEFIVMSDEIQRYAGGLPLALTVFVSTLSNEDKGGWEWFMDKLKRVPIEDIEEKLMISFEALKLVDPILQDIFLDIACFFVGHEKAETVLILQTCYKVLNHYIGLLQKRCLITIKDNKLLMHDLLRDMGRKIARNGSRQNEPEKHSRLFASEDIQDILKNKKGTEAIEGMVGRDYMSSYSIDVETFNMMPNLRFLRLCYIKDIRGSFGKPFKDLRWLSWKSSNFCADKLVILQLPFSNICRFEEKALVLGNLKILDMSWSRQLSNTPDFNGLPYLETLYLSFCESLVEVDISIGNLVRLATLDLWYCTSLTSLPESICKLRALKSLDLTSCSSLKALPMELGNIESLTDLKADGLSISQLPDSLGRMIVLKADKLKLEACDCLQSICNMRSVENLSISGCNFLQLANLQLPSTLKDLKAYNCMSLPNLSNLQQLDKMSLSGCSSLSEINGLEKIVSTKELHLDECESIQGLPNVSNLQQLEKLYLSDCSSLTEIEGLEKLVFIKELHLDECESVQGLPNLSNLQHLEKLYLSDCSNLTEIEGLEKLVSVKELHLGGFASMKGLPSLSNLPLLRILHLNGCSSLTKIEGLEKLISIEEISIVNCRSLKRLPNLSDWKKLKTLQLYGCSSLTEIQGLGEVITLTKLDLRGCMSLTRLPNLSNLQQLHTLQVRDCRSLTEIQGLEKISSVTILNLEGCTSSPDLSSLQLMEGPDISLEQLHTMQVRDCRSLTEIQDLKKISSVTTLNLEGCTLSPDLSSLQLMEGPDISLQLITRLPDLSRLQAVLDLNVDDLDSSGYRDNISSDNEDGAISDGDVSTDLDSSGYLDNISSDNEDGAISDGDVSTELYLGRPKISGVTPSKKLKLNNGNASTSGSKKN